MGLDPITNLAKSTIQAGSTIIGSSGTPKTIILETGDGVDWPTGGEYNVVVWPGSAEPTMQTAEFVRVTRSGDVLTTSARGQEGTDPLSTIAAGYQVMRALTAKDMEDVIAASDAVGVEIFNEMGNAEFGTTGSYVVVWNANGHVLGAVIDDFKEKWDAGLRPEFMSTLWTHVGDAGPSTITWRVAVSDFDNNGTTNVKRDAFTIGGTKGATADSVIVVPVGVNDRYFKASGWMRPTLTAPTKQVAIVVLEGKRDVGTPQVDRFEIKLRWVRP